MKRASSTTYEIEHKGFRGIARYDYHDALWHGKILDIDDLVMFSTDDLVGIVQEFITAVDDYIDTRVDIGRGQIE